MKIYENKQTEQYKQQLSQEVSNFYLMLKGENNQADIIKLITLMEPQDLNTNLFEFLIENSSSLRNNSNINERDALYYMTPEDSKLTLGQLIASYPSLQCKTKNIDEIYRLDYNHEINLKNSKLIENPKKSKLLFTCAKPDSDVIFYNDKMVINNSNSEENLCLSFDSVQIFTVAINNITVAPTNYKVTLFIDNLEYEFTFHTDELKLIVRFVKYLDEVKKYYKLKDMEFLTPYQAKLKEKIYQNA